MKINKLENIVIGTDANYLHKAVIFYESLYKHYKKITLHIFCFDEVSYKTLATLKYKNVILYSTSQFETKQLLELKKTKNRMYEYYWAVNAYITKFVMDKYNPESVTFSDCDCMFFKSPKSIFDEVKKADVLIQPNNFSYLSVKDFIPVGYYCSSFVYFRNNPKGRKAMNWWHDQCMKWCSCTFEEGKFGDQKYLDDWRIRFKGVREVANPGANVAPWNVQKYDLEKIGDDILLNGKWPLIYYHYHSFKMNLDDYKYIVTGDRENSYVISDDLVQKIYLPYIKQMKTVLKKLKRIKIYRDYVKINPKGVQLDFKGNKIFKDNSVSP